MKAALLLLLALVLAAGAWYALAPPPWPGLREDLRAWRYEGKKDIKQLVKLHKSCLRLQGEERLRCVDLSAWVAQDRKLCDPHATQPHTWEQESARLLCDIGALLETSAKAKHEYCGKLKLFRNLSTCIQAFATRPGGEEFCLASPNEGMRDTCFEFRLQAPVAFRIDRLD